jgi:hypothetical protein
MQDQDRHNAEAIVFSAMQAANPPVRESSGFSVDIPCCQGYNTCMNQPSRNLAKPWPRLAMACLLTIWAGANLWFAMVSRESIWSDDIPSRTAGLFLTILFANLPLVIAIYLFWSIVVGPDDDLAAGKKRG